MKKFFCFALVLLLSISGICVYADEALVTAPSAVLIEETTGEILYEQNAYELLPCASITKVMTLILVMEAIERGDLGYDDILTASAYAASMGGSDIWLVEGETMSVDDLLKATVIMSANDAAVVLAEAVAGSTTVFVQMMNEKAVELGMFDTTFKNCNGLDEDGHLTTAYDVALMSRELMKYEKITDYTLTWIDYLRDGETQLVNTNKLIRTYDGITGLKTGTTTLAGSCLSVTATRDDLSLIAVVLGAETTDDRFSDGAALLDYGFSNYNIVTPEVPEIPDVEVTGGMTNIITVETPEITSILTTVKNGNDISTEIYIEENLEAPIEIGQIIGTLTYTLGDITKEIPIKSAVEVEKISFHSALIRIFQIFLS